LDLRSPQSSRQPLAQTAGWQGRSRCRPIIVAALDSKQTSEVAKGDGEGVERLELLPRWFGHQVQEEYEAILILD